MQTQQTNRSTNRCDRHVFTADDLHIDQYKNKLLAVILLNVLMMVFEVVFGYISGSMALLADGWHMASHLAALSIGWLAYKLTQSKKFSQHFSFGAGKVIPLGGYTSALILGMIALMMMYEAILRLFSEKTIHYNEALAVSIIGLVVNILGVFILKTNDEHHHDHGEHAHAHSHSHDHNIKGAYAHILADLLTSVLAVVSLIICRKYEITWIDSAIGILGGIIILKWSIQLCNETGWELLDGHTKLINQEELVSLLAKEKAEVVDVHLWRIAPKAVACELVVRSLKPRGAKFYRDLVLKNFQIQHLVIEELL